MSTQNPVTLQIPILPDREKDLDRLLTSFGNPAGSQSTFPFEKFENVHFARWFLVPATVIKGEKVQPSVMYTANIDGSATDHLNAMADQIPEVLDRILNHCVGYPDKGSRTPQSRISFLDTHRISTQAFYIGAPKRTVQQIHQEAALQSAVRTFFDGEEGAAVHSPRAALDAVRKWLASDNKWDWATKPFRLPGIKWARAILLGIVVLVVLIPVAILIVLIHFLYENKLQPLGLDINQLDPERLQKLKDQEDIIYQNQLTQVFEMKPGLRKIFLRFILWFTNELANTVEVKGNLLGTPTIHFARWVIIDQGRRFIFVSNFDGSYDEYLGDFIDNGGWGLNAIYSNSKGYPRTKFIFWKGSYLIGQFLAWGRFYQVPTQTWYSAYPDFGLPQIISRSKLRVGLFSRKNLDSSEIADVLRRI